MIVKSFETIPNHKNRIIVILFGFVNGLISIFATADQKGKFCGECNLSPYLHQVVGHRGDLSSLNGNYFSKKNHKSISTENSRKKNSSKKVPKLQIMSDNWGRAGKKEILSVLNSVASEIFPFGGKHPYAPIIVGRSENGPIVLFKRGKNGQYLINLNAKDLYWCQYAFQFSHEIGHILCGFKPGNSSNLWFEESICEIASLFVLKKLENQWSTHPPYPNWYEYAPEFTKYAMERIKKHKNQIQIDLTKWFRANENTLKSDPNDRIRNLAVAIRLLPLFEKFPTGWGACAYLNESKTNQEKSFPVYLSDWYHACPNQNQKWFVEKIASKFGIALPSLH